MEGNSITHKVRQDIGLNSKSVYYFNFSEIVGSLETVKIAPVYKNGKRGDVVSILKISNVVNVPVQGVGAGKIYVKPGTDGGNGPGPVVPGPCVTTKGCSDYYLTNDCGNDLFDGCGNVLDCECESGKFCNSTNKCEDNPIVPIPDCEDGICNNGETCSSCPEDCGVCVTSNTLVDVYPSLNVRAGEEVFFNAFDYKEADNTIQRFDWDFGDTTGSYYPRGGVSVTHFYSYPGSYIVTLYFTNSSGMQKVSFPIVVSGKASKNNAMNALNPSIKINFDSELKDSSGNLILELINPLSGGQSEVRGGRLIQTEDEGLVAKFDTLKLIE
jgi:hypothetical protein